MRSDDAESRPGSDRQWWLTEGPETCFLCEGAVHPELLKYCIACDRGLCLFCLNGGPAQGEVVCPECKAQQDRDKDAC